VKVCAILHKEGKTRTIQKNADIVTVRQYFWKSTHIRKIMSRNSAGRHVNGTFAGAAAQYSFWAGIPDIDVIAGMQGPQGAKV